MDTYRENLEGRFNRLVVFFYCLLMITLPISIALVELMAGIVIIIFVYKKYLLCRHESKGKRQSEVFRIIISSFYPQGHFLNKWFGLYILSMFISVVFSQYPVSSFIAFVGKLLEGYFLYYSFVDCVKTKNDFSVCMIWCALTAVVMAGDGIFQYVFRWDFFRHLPFAGGRVSATFRHANDFGAYLVSCIPIVFGLMILVWRRKECVINELKSFCFINENVLKFFLLVGFLLMLGCLGLTFSRGAWVGFWISMFLFVLIIRKYFVVSLLVSVLFLGAFLPLMIKYRDVSFTTDSVDLQKNYANIEPTAENLNKLRDFEQDRVKIAHKFQLGMGRFGFWEEAWEVIRKYPFFGSGLNTYSKMTTIYAHNCYLQLAAETGFIGLGLFLILLGSLIIRAIRSCWKMSLSFQKIILAGSISGFVGFMVQSFFDTTLYSVQLGNLMWVMMGVIAVAQYLDLGLNKLTKV